MEILRKDEIFICRDKDIIERTQKALEILNPKLPPKGSLILIKPNLVEPKHKTSGAITRPEVVEAIIQFLGDRNYQIIVGEGSAVPITEIAFWRGGYRYLARKYKIKLINLNRGPFVKIKTHQEIWPEFEVNKLAKEADYLISVAPLKEHSFGVTLTIKNLMGCLKPKGIPNKSYMHPNNNLELWVKRMALLYQHLKPHLAVIDGTTAMYGSHINGRLEQKDLTIVGEDALTVDLAGAEILGQKKVSYLEILKN